MFYLDDICPDPIARVSSTGSVALVVIDVDHTKFNDAYPRSPSICVQ